MTFIGYLSGIIIFAALWGTFATGRKSWFVTVFWAGIMFVMSLGAKRGLPVNGLCLCIAFVETIVSIRAIYGVRVWNQSFKDKGIILPIVIYVITVLLVGYCVVQIQNIGYVPNIMHFDEETRMLGKIFNVAVILIISLPPAYIGLLRFERFFSNPQQLTLLNCKFYTSNLIGGTVFKGYYMYGITNGVKHYFRITKRAYIMLRFEERAVFEVQKDLRGNMYVIKNPCPENLQHIARRDIRLAKNIAMSAVVYIILLIIVI